MNRVNFNNAFGINGQLHHLPLTRKLLAFRRKTGCEFFIIGEGQQGRPCPADAEGDGSTVLGRRFYLDILRDELFPIGLVQTVPQRHGDKLAVAIGKGADQYRCM